MANDDNLLQWLTDHLEINNPAIEKTLGGGNSNVTMLLSSDDGDFVLRHPPVNTISDLAGSGIEREARVLAALRDKKLRVPGFVGFCDDQSIIGSPFLVSTFVDGVAITDSLPGGYDEGGTTLQTIGEELVDAIAEIHSLDWQTLELPGFRASSAFLTRQLERWLKIRQQDRVRDLPLFEKLAKRLNDQLPVESFTTLMHGDFHLDNTLFLKDSPKLGAIIDWELAAIGDPRVDLGLLLAFWGPREIESPALPFVQQVTRDDSAPSREYLARRWSAKTGMEADNYHYFCAFAFWRLAAMVEGAYVLFKKGKVDSDYARNLEFDVPALLQEAELFLNRST